jgi:hypothetical protein
MAGLKMPGMPLSAKFHLLITRFSSFYRLTASHFAELKDLLNSLPHTRPLGI